jgi:predicted ester cyclase
MVCMSHNISIIFKGILMLRVDPGAMNRGDWKTASTPFAEDAKNFGRPAGREHVALILQDIRTTFPNFRPDIVDLVAKDDWVVVPCRETGTHSGVGRLSVNGGMLVGVTPTHKHFEVDVVHWYTLRDGKIVDSDDSTKAALLRKAGETARRPVCLVRRSCRRPPSGLLR